MIDMDKLEWGLRPLRKIEVLAIYGARTIFQNGIIEFLWDRQGFLGGDSQRHLLRNWINGKALPALKKHIKEKNWTGTTSEKFILEDWPFVLEASVNCSYGYLYISGYFIGLETFPTIDGHNAQWSGSFTPQIGDSVFCTTDDIGKAEVLGFYLEHGWIGVLVKPEAPPERYIRQNGKDAICGVFGVDIAQSDDKQ